MTSTRHTVSPLAMAVITLLVLFVSLNLYQLVATPPELLQAKIQSTSISKGESYLGTLRLWKIYVLHGDWVSAHQLESRLDPADTEYYRRLYSPDSLKSQINLLQFRVSKTSEDWVTLAQLYYRMGDKSLARTALLQAQSIDPIRDDIPTLLSTLN